MPWRSGAGRPSVGAFAVTLAIAAAVRAQPPTPKPHPQPQSKSTPVAADRTPPPLMPVEPVWTLALNNALTAAPAYDGTQAFFSIEGDRLVAYDLLTGAQQWLIHARPVTDPVAGGGLIFLREADTLKALRTADGSLAWSCPSPSALRSIRCGTTAG